MPARGVEPLFRVYESLVLPLNYAGLNNKLTLTQTSYILNIMSVFSSIIEYFKA